MLITMGRSTWNVTNNEQLLTALQFRDQRGGADFWLQHMEDVGAKPSFPALSIRISGQSAYAVYFPDQEHPGYRCCGKQDLDPDRMATFTFDGCDPHSGEDVPYQFILDHQTAYAIASEFLSKDELPEIFEWFEL